MIIMVKRKCQLIFGMPQIYMMEKHINFYKRQWQVNLANGNFKHMAFPFQVLVTSDTLLQFEMEYGQCARENNSHQ